MTFAAPLRTLTSPQRNAFLANFLGWTLDAFDFIVLAFVMKDMAKEFHVSKAQVELVLTLTLACRPIGALLFGGVAGHYGRCKLLTLNTICYWCINLLCGFAPSLTVLFIVRAGGYSHGCY